MRYGVDITNFGEYADPRNVIRLAQMAETAGWEGLFVWDHLGFVWGVLSGWPANERSTAGRSRGVGRIWHRPPVQIRGWLRVLHGSIPGPNHRATRGARSAPSRPPGPAAATLTPRTAGPIPR
jgi:hypothetical protein